MQSGVFTSLPPIPFLNYFLKRQAGSSGAEKDTFEIQNTFEILVKIS